MYIKDLGWGFAVFHNGKQISNEYLTEDEAWDYMQEERERW